MILAILTFRFAQLGLSNLFNFIFVYWYVDYSYLYLTSILMLLVICIPATKPYAKNFLYTVFILGMAISILVIFKSITSIVVAAIIGIDILFLIILISLRINLSILKKVLLILL